MVKRGDYILVTDAEHERYLQIGEIVNIDCYPYDGYIMSYEIRFADGVAGYDWRFADSYKVLAFERD